LPIYI